ncbi:MAG: transglutaminase-like domain-containing protein [Actinomycetota bacterium]|nr:transglutaminase-like domain-containing protein [Actinomycetota bacterium]
MEPTSRFAEIMAGPEASVPLDEAALLVAAAVRPGLDMAAERARLDELGAAVRAPTLDALRKCLFVELGFAGDGDDYYDPRNSCLDQVVERRLGIPITLSVLTLEVGRRVGVPLAGVSMPGHFLVRDEVDPEVFVDPFAGGAVLDAAGCEARFRALHGPGAAFDPGFLRPVGARSIVARMLANLDAVATARGDRPLLERVVRMRTLVPGAPAPLRRRLAEVLASSCRFGEAADVLDRLAAADTGVDDALAARRLRARLN